MVKKVTYIKYWYYKLGDLFEKMSGSILTREEFVMKS